MKHRLILLFALIIIVAATLAGCNGKVTFDDLVIMADSAKDVPEGVYTMRYTIDNIEEYDKNNEVEVSVKVLDNKLKTVEVKNNRTFNVVKDGVYSVTVTVSGMVNGEFRAKKLSYTVAAIKSDPTITFRLSEKYVYKTLTVARNTSFGEFSAIYERAGVGDTPPDYYEYANTDIYVYKIESKKWSLYMDGQFVAMDINIFQNINENIEVRAEYVRSQTVRVLKMDFETDGGTSIPRVTGTSGTVLSQPERPVKEGYTFVGWCDTAERTTFFPWTNATLTRNLTLYAKWVKNNVADSAYYANFDFEEQYDAAFQRKYYYVKAKDKNNLPADLVLPNGYDNIPVEGIAARGFSGSAVTSVTFPNVNFNNAYYAFSGCRYLTQVFFDGETVVTTRFDSGMFEDCVSLTEIAVPSDFTSIGEYTFSGCVNLSSLVISADSKLTSLGIKNQTYLNCNKLKEVTLPKYFKDTDRKYLPFDDTVVIKYHS